MTAIHPTAIVHSKARLGENVEIGAYAIVGEHVEIGDGTKIHPHVCLDGHTAIGKGCAIFPFASIGSQTQDLKFKGGVTYVRIGDRTTIREYVTVNSGTAEGEVTQVGANCLLMANSHVAHQCKVGNGVIMANSVALAGHIVVEDCAVIGGLTGVHQFVRIGTMAMIGGLTKINQDVPPYFMVDGNPARPHGLNGIGLERRGVSAETQSALKKAYKILYMQNRTTRDALEKIRAELPGHSQVDHLVSFIAASERGIVK